MMKPKISIIIPVYNVEQYLERCLNSIASQSYSNLEIILVNDGSSDSSGEICERFVQKDPRFIVIHQPNQGSSSARNKGLKQASGTYIGFVDSDDYIDPEMYNLLLQCALKESLSLVTCDFQLSSGKIISNPLGTTSASSKSIGIDEHLSTMDTLPNGLFNVWNKLFHRDIIQGIEFIYGKIHQDALFMSEVYKRIQYLGLVPIPLYNYYDLNESITRGPFNKKRVEAIEVIVSVYENLMSTSQSETSQKSIRHWFMIWLLYTYGNLCLNPKLDSDSMHRKKIKELIILHSGEEKGDFRIMPAKVLPFWMYGMTHKLYMAAISIRGALR